MEPLLFGETDHRVYGVYHGAERARARSEGVVLFYPVGQEYMRIHRAYRWLASHLAALGFHVMRFDYSGQGDSVGDFADVDLACWQRDGAAAIAELEAISGCERITLVGTRLGGTIAAANCSHRLVDRLVLWEPRTPGTMLTNEIAEQIDSAEWPLANFREADGTTHINGFAYPASFIASIAASSIEAAQLASVRAVLSITSMKKLDMSSLFEPARKLGINVCERYAEGPTDWNRVDGIGGMFLPQRILHEIGEWIERDRA